ncbi:MAG TPA: patatin-like phospholipase family protein [Solirubrobacteraceae bacterium]|nr:patatin-like phospholipase family protein [Solirubrobacteraceae bacterium]
MGLVLGAGGVLGGAWLAGALHAIVSETGWDPGSADYIVGTSAGSMVGALIASGMPPWLIVQCSAGETFDGLTDVRLRRSGFVPRPGSWRLALASLSRPSKYSPMVMIAGWLPQGIVSTEPLKGVVRGACASGWTPHPNFWPVAVDYRTGRRVAFGRPGSPKAELPDAVAASCAIPGFYRNVEINGRSYVDGGVHSVSNIDVLRNEPLDAVVALNPMSPLHQRPPRNVAERLAYAVRKAASRRLVWEAERLRAAGIQVVLIQPTTHDLDAMGSDLMSELRRHEVVQTAVRTTTRQLHEAPVGARLAQLARAGRRLPGGSDQLSPNGASFSRAADERRTGARAA